MRSRATILFLLAFFFPSLLLAQNSRSPKELYTALNDLKLDPSAVFVIPPASRIEIRRGDALLSFEEGHISFFAPLDGKITGAVFNGRAHVLLAPRDPTEKQQLAFFIGAPILDQDVSSAYIRFTDDTAEELQHQFQTAGILPASDLGFVSRWDSTLVSLNILHSLRIMSDSLSGHPRPHFYAGVEGLATGPFDLVFDQDRDEPMFLGQAHRQGSAVFFDVWASYLPPGVPPRSAAFRSVSYSLDTTIQSDSTLSSSATVQLYAETGGERLVSFQLSRNLRVKSVTAESGESLEFLQNEGMTQQQRDAQGNDALYVVLPSAPKAGEEFRFTINYSGRVIQDSGNGVYFVSARESWYPHIGDASDFARYDLTMRWPRRLRLAATGTKLDEKEEGDFRIGHWKTENLAAVAGFNLGEYAFASVASGNYSVDVYANRQLEMSLERRLHTVNEDVVANMGIPGGLRAQARLEMPSTQPSPADGLKHLAREIDSSIRFYEGYAGPFPFKQLAVSQIPGSFGQGWPGLLYLSTYSFLQQGAQERVGLSGEGQEQFSELVPFHEAAHQWWGNVVGWSSYRDQWVDEALASYLALLFADSQKTPDRRTRIWLDRYRAKLEAKLPDSQLIVADIGAIGLGNRLSSSKAPNGFEEVIYPKGAWIIHMIREMLRQPAVAGQPGSKNPDARFQAFLQKLYSSYSYRALSTADLLHELNAVMTPAMDLDGNHSMEWFIEDWVRGTGVPHYRIEYSSKRTEKGFAIKGKLFQTRVPRGFVAPVPIYSAGGAYLGRVIAAGDETPFHFNVATDTGKLQIDPQMTLLCVVDHQKPPAE